MMRYKIKKDWIITLAWAVNPYQVAELQTTRFIAQA